MFLGSVSGREITWFPAGQHLSAASLFISAPFPPPSEVFRIRESEWFGLEGTLQSSSSRLRHGQGLFYTGFKCDTPATVTSEYWTPNQVALELFCYSLCSCYQQMATTHFYSRQHFPQHRAHVSLIISSRLQNEIIHAALSFRKAAQDSWQLGQINLWCWKSD